MKTAQAAESSAPIPDDCIALLVSSTNWAGRQMAPPHNDPYAYLRACFTQSM
jgi:hypothetical protein